MIGWIRIRCRSSISYPYNTPSNNQRFLEQSLAPGTFFSSHTLSFLRWDHLNLGREPRMRHRINRPVFHLRARRIFPQEVVTLPIRRRPNRSRNKSAAAIWADTSQNLFDTGRAEGALIRADARLKRLRRQRPVAMLARRSEFKHGALHVKLPIMGDQWFLEQFSAHPSIASFSNITTGAAS